MIGERPGPGPCPAVMSDLTGPARAGQAADDDTKLLFENEDAWAEKEARKAFLEP